MSADAFARNPSVMTGMHDGAKLYERHHAIADAFSQMLLHPGAVNALGQPVLDAIDGMHRLNVELFGFRDAEVLRAEAFAEAVASTIPVGEATETAPGELDGGAS